jgi:hypothetical protein
MDHSMWRVAVLAAFACGACDKEGALEAEAPPQAVDVSGGEVEPIASVEEDDDFPRRPPPPPPAPTSSCEAAIAAWRACAAKMPPSAQQALDDAFQQFEKMLAQMQEPSQRETFESTCRSILDAFSANPACR